MPRHPAWARRRRRRPRAPLGRRRRERARLLRRPPRLRDHRRDGRRALFVSAGGYHHHMAMNTWNSARRRPARPRPRARPGRDPGAGCRRPRRAAGADVALRRRRARRRSDAAFDDPWANLIQVRAAGHPAPDVAGMPRGDTPPIRGGPFGSRHPRPASAPRVDQGRRGPLLCTVWWKPSASSGCPAARVGSRPQPVEHDAELATPVIVAGRAAGCRWRDAEHVDEDRHVDPVDVGRSSPSAWARAMRAASGASIRRPGR